MRHLEMTWQATAHSPGYVELTTYSDPPGYFFHHTITRERAIKGLRMALQAMFIVAALFTLLPVAALTELVWSHSWLSFVFVCVIVLTYVSTLYVLCYFFSTVLNLLCNELGVDSHEFPHRTYVNSRPRP